MRPLAAIDPAARTACSSPPRSTILKHLPQECALYTPVGNRRTSESALCSGEAQPNGLATHNHGTSPKRFRQWRSGCCSARAHGASLGRPWTGGTSAQGEGQSSKGEECPASLSSEAGYHPRAFGNSIMQRPVDPWILLSEPCPSLGSVPAMQIRPSRFGCTLG